MYVRNQMLENARRKARLNRIKDRGSVRDDVLGLFFLLLLFAVGSLGFSALFLTIAELVY